MFPAPYEPPPFTHASALLPPASPPLPTRTIQHSALPIVQAAGTPRAPVKPFLATLDKLLEMQLKELARELDPKEVMEVYSSQDLRGKRESWLKRIHALQTPLAELMEKPFPVSMINLIDQMRTLLKVFENEASLTLVSATRKLERGCSFLIDRLVQQKLSRTNCVAIEALFDLLAPFGLKDFRERCELWRAREEEDPRLPRSDAYSSLPEGLNFSFLAFRCALKKVALSVGEIRACRDFDGCIDHLEAEVQRLMKLLAEQHGPKMNPSLLECSLFRIPIPSSVMDRDLALTIFWAHFEHMVRRVAISDEHVRQIQEIVAPAFFKNPEEFFR